MKPILVVMFMLGLIAVGCVSPDQRAEKLYRSGKYEAVLERYLNSQWADSANAIADTLQILRSRILLHIHSAEKHIEELEDIRWEFKALLDSVDMGIAAVRKNQKEKP